MATNSRVRVPFNDLSGLAHDSEIRAAVDDVVRSGWYVLGRELAAFESEFAAYLGVRDVVGVANGTDALVLAMAALGIGKGDEVVVAANAGGYATGAALRVGATPRFADVEPQTHLLDLDRLPEALTSRTKAVVATHLYGNPIDVERLRTVTGVQIIEDCAQAHGALVRGRKVGSLGDVAAFSFYPTKNLGALGDGGAVATGSADAASALRSLRQYGWSTRYHVERPFGLNSRLDEIHAATLRVGLRKLDERNHTRRSIVERYRQGISHQLITPMAELPDCHQGVAHLAVIEVRNRAGLIQHLDACGVGTGVHYPIPDHRQPAWQSVMEPDAAQRLSVTEHLAGHVLSLPCFPELDPDAVQLVIDACNEWGAA